MTKNTRSKEDSTNTMIKSMAKNRKLFITNFYTATEQLGFDICHTPELHNEIMNIMETNYNPPIFPNTGKIIKELTQRCTLAVESSNYKRAMKRVLTAHGLEKYFAVIAGADKEPSKTKRLQNLLQKIRPAAALFVTDTVGDISEAKKAGIPCITVSWGYNTYRQLKKAHPLDTARTPEELVKKINDHFG